SYTLATYIGLTSGDEANLIRALYNIGPISIHLNTASDEFLFYRSGILDIPNCNPDDLHHSALAVGYSLGEKPYLLVKNSWGDGGYFKIALFKNNMCGIASRAIFPIMSY
ncbi:hypothetical protein MXB_3828, partial [Myxobolus squamalis]